METLFINRDSNYDYQVDENETGVTIINVVTGAKYNFNFQECPSYSGALEKKEKIIYQLSFTSTSFFYVLEKDGKLFGVRQNIRDKNNNRDSRIRSYDKHLKFHKTGIATVTMYLIQNGKELFAARINGLLSRKQQNEWLKIKLPIKDKKILGSIMLEGRSFFVTYYPKKESVSLSKVFVEEADSRINSVAINNRSNVEIEFENKKYNFDFRKKENRRGTKIFGSDEKLPNDIILTFKVNKKKYYIYSYKKRNYLTTIPRKAYGVKSNLKVKFYGSNAIIFGKYNNSYKRITGDCDYLYIKAEDKPIGKFKRPFGNFWKSFVFSMIPVSRLVDTEEIHRGMYLGNESQNLFPLYMNNKLAEDFQVFGKKKMNKDIVIFRANVGDGTSCTILPFAEEYSFISTVKQRLARVLEGRGHKNRTNLYFEKFAAKADESAIKVFEKVQAQSTTSDNYFILDQRSPDFNKLKKRYGKNVVKKYSLQHYRLIYRADYFISSEFSNHVINDRIFINHLRNKIMKTPLIFLQHGIMFAKPIENPMAAGFRKKNVKINLKKIVVSSELEAKEFYKVGYQPSDLLLTGLATFDNPVVDKLTKYAYMPTYRFWEEHLVYEGRLEETGYYRDIKNVIKAFEDNGLMDKLLIVPHNKFANYIMEHFPDYKGNICTNPSKALTVSKIFITDYSSAIYDAVNRGAYPIFWWKEKELLIEKYQATPSLNENTAPGPIAYNEKELIKEIFAAEKNNYNLSTIYKKKYRLINSFSDNKNTERILAYLKSQKIV